MNESNPWFALAGGLVLALGAIGLFAHPMVLALAAGWWAVWFTAVRQEVARREGYVLVVEDLHDWIWTSESLREAMVRQLAAQLEGQRRVVDGHIQPYGGGQGR